MYESSDPLIFPLICTALEKMAHCSVCLPSVTGERTLIEMNETGFGWKKVNVPDDLKFKFPSNSCKNFYLLADLRGDLDGRI